MVFDRKTEYVDANVFLNAILYDPGENPEARHSVDFLETIKQDKVRAITSLLTWDEFVWVVRKEFGLETARNKGREFLSFPHLKFIEVTITLIARSQDILDQYRVKPRDAIHLATALASSASTFVTLDSRLNDIGIIPCDDLSAEKQS
ncbi:MAG TPA: type II toxin-antitoxin system VapC family toxin [Candidatus Lokiarchaeia archaeon]|nr:type II toxin-antitoxin system VapC family toxin [Candidatus Lokiarchaeia archaeon]